MMTHIYLRPEEEVVFSKLSESVRNGWTVEQESITTKDTPARMRMRMQLMRLHDPKLKQFISAAHSNGSADELVELLSDTDLKDISDPDLEELFFALGPTVLDVFIPLELSRVSSDDEMEGVVALSVIRHSLLESLSS